MSEIVFMAEKTKGVRGVDQIAVELGKIMEPTNNQCDSWSSVIFFGGLKHSGEQQERQEGARDVIDLISVRRGQLGADQQRLT